MRNYKYPFFLFLLLMSNIGLLESQTQGVQYIQIPREGFTSECIEIDNSKITLQLLNSSLQIEEGLFSEDKEAGVKYEISVTSESNGVQPITFCQTSRVEQWNDGPVYIGNKYNIFRNMNLSNDNININSVKVDITYYKKRGTTTFGYAFQKVVELSKMTLLPENPFSDKIKPYLNLVNDLISPNNPELAADGVSDITYTFNFGSCENLDNTKTGCFALIQSIDFEKPIGVGQLPVIINKLDDYDFKLGQGNQLQAKLKNDTKYLSVPNTYLILLLTKELKNPLLRSNTEVKDLELMNAQISKTLNDDVGNIINFAPAPNR